MRIYENDLKEQIPFLILILIGIKARHFTFLHCFYYF